MSKMLKIRIFRSVLLHSVSLFSWHNQQYFAISAKYQQLYSQFTNPFSQCPGKTQIFYRIDVAFLDRLLQRQPSIYLDKVQAKFREDQGIEIQS